MTIPITPPEATVAITSEYHRWLIDRSDRLAEAERLLRECREFVDMHSEDWYRRGQELLRKIDAALSTADSADDVPNLIDPCDGEIVNGRCAKCGQAETVSEVTK
jgi:hypothetical protein